MKLSKKAINNIFFVVGIVAIVVMMFTFDVSFSELWDHICHAGYWMFPIVGVWVLIYFVNALAWKAIIDSNADPHERIDIWRVYRLTISGYALNNTTPVGGLGGEPYRILELTKDMTNDHATSSVILYAMMHIYSHFWFWFTSVFLYLGLAWHGDVPMTAGIGVTICLVLLFCAGGFWFFAKGYGNGVAIKLIRWAGKIPGLKGWSIRFLENHGETLQKVDQQIAALHKQDKRSFYKSLILEYVARVMLGFEVMFILLLFGENCGGGWDGYCLLFLHCVMIEAITSLCANIVGFLPMQLGVQEGGYVLSIAALGLSPAIGIFISIISRVRQVIWDIIGIALMKVKYDGRH